MNHSGDAAEQIVRMSLEGVEVAAKITGGAAKEIALLLLAALKNNNKNSLKLKGKARLTSMLKSGKALEIFSVRESDLKKFVQGAKQYGIVYCVLRNPKNSPDRLCDIMVKADDAPKISRLVERFKFATVDRAGIESEILSDRAEHGADAEPEATPDAPINADAGDMNASDMPSADGMEPPDINDTEQLLNELFGMDEGRAESEPSDLPDFITEPIPDTPVKSGNPENPDPATTAEPRPSEPISERRSKSERGTSSKPSVKAELAEITAAKKKKEADALMPEPPADDKPKNAPVTKHRPPSSRRKHKKTKGGRS